MTTTADGNTPVLDEQTMRDLGFTDRRPGTWYWVKRVGDRTTLNISINKATGDYTELVMDEDFGQPAYYGHMKPVYRDEIRDNVDRFVAELNTAGLTIVVDHELYGVTVNDEALELLAVTIQETIDTHYVDGDFADGLFCTCGESDDS